MSYTYQDKEYPQVKARFKWILGSYDGPMSGIAIYENKLYYAKCHQNIGANPPRYYWLYPLTDTEIKKEIWYHRLFRYYYGLHGDVRDDGKRCKTWEDIGEEPPAYPEYPKELGKPSYNLMEKWAGLRWNRREEYVSRESIGFFSLYD